MPSPFYFYYFGAVPLAPTEEEEEEAAEIPRWIELSGAAHAWQAGPRAGILPRFNRIYQQEAGTPQFERTTDAVN